MTDFLRRLIDIAASAAALAVLSPVLILISLLVCGTSRGGVFYRTQRVGRYGKPFILYKFRSMVSGADRMGGFCVSDTDSRVTGIGRFLRISKLDEFPQLFNVLKGDMTLVGPRPDVAHFIETVSEEQRNVILGVKPGLSDWASLYGFSQYKKYAKAPDPDRYQHEYLQPIKLALQVYYCRHRSLLTDFRIILTTALKLFGIRVPLPRDVQEIVDGFEDPFDRDEQP